MTASRSLLRHCVTKSCLLSAIVLISVAGSAPLSAESSREARNVYAEAASYQANEQYDLAAEQWEKFLERFPDDELARKAHYYAGVCQVQEGEFSKAAAHCQAALEPEGDFDLAEDAYLNLGWSQYSLGRRGQGEEYAKAVRSFETLIENFPEGKYVDQAFFYLGEAHYAREQLDEAIEAYSQVVERHEQSELHCDALYALGATYEELKQFDEAGKVYDRFLATCRESELVPEIRMRKAETVLQAGQPAEAERLFGEVAEMEGFESADHAMLRQALCAARQERYAEAGQLYRGLMERFPDSRYRSEAAIAAGRCYYRAGDFAQSTRWLKKSIQAKSRFAAEATHWLCRIELADGEPERAEKLAERALSVARESPYLVHLKLDWADALYEQDERQSKSIGGYLAIARKHPEHELAPQALYNAAFGLLEIGEYEEALKYVASFLNRYGEDPLVPDVRYVAAESQLQLQQYAEATKAYRELIDRYADHADTDLWHLRLAQALLDQDKYDDLVGFLSPLVADFQSPDDVAQARHLMGLARFRQKQYEAAAGSLEASLAGRPKGSQADETLLYLSRALQQQNQLEAAERKLQRLIEQFPESEILDEAYYRLGQSRYAAKRLDRAKEAYQTLIENWPDSTYVPYALYGIGWSCHSAGVFSDGAESFGALIEGHPDHELVAEARFARGLCLRRAGQHAEAIEELATFLEASTSGDQQSDALYEQGLCQVALEEFEAAAATFEELLEQDEDYERAANAFYELAWARKQLDQAEASAAAFARLAERYPDQELAAEAFFHVGEDHYRGERFSQAVEAYTQAKQRAAAQEDAEDLAEQAEHKLAWSFYRLGQFERAAERFQQQAQDHPDGSLYADALFMQAECRFKQENYEAAWPRFEAVRDSMPSSPQLRTLALLHGGQCAGQLERWEDSLSWLNSLLEQFPDTGYSAEALYARGRAQQKLERMDDAIEDFERAASLSRTAVGARARFMIGEILFERKDYAAAINSYRRVMYGYDATDADAEVKHWQGLAAYEAGRCAEVRIREAKTRQSREKLLADAKTFFQFVVDKHAQHELADQAAERLAELTKLSG